MTFLFRLRPLGLVCVASASLVLAGTALSTGVALAQTGTSAPAAPVSSVSGTATISAAVLNAGPRVKVRKPMRVRHVHRVANRPMAAVREQCSWFWCGRQQVSMLFLGIGF